MLLKIGPADKRLNREADKPGKLGEICRSPGVPTTSMYSPVCAYGRCALHPLMLRPISNLQTSCFHVLYTPKRFSISRKTAGNFFVRPQRFRAAFRLKLDRIFSSTFQRILHWRLQPCGTTRIVENSSHPLLRYIRLKICRRLVYSMGIFFCRLDLNDSEPCFWSGTQTNFIVEIPARLSPRPDNLRTPFAGVGGGGVEKFIYL